MHLLLPKTVLFRPLQIYMEYLGAEKMRDKLIFQYEVVYLDEDEFQNFLLITGFN